jgi:thymidylate synthase (FAD)
MAESSFEYWTYAKEMAKAKQEEVDAAFIGGFVPPTAPAVPAVESTEELTKNITWDDVKDDPNAIKVLDYGFIVLEETMGSDKAIVKAARVSYGAGTKKVSEDRGLLRYLLRHYHTTPFEMCEAKFLVKMPIFVMRQWIRHRTANVNELSGRYSELPEEFFLPDQWRGQSKTNKQGGEEPIEYQYPHMSGMGEYAMAEKVAFGEYHERLKAGVSKELARTCLPVSTYTTAYWKCDLHNIMHFLRLRLDKHAQYEIRVYAEAIYKLLQPKFPMAFEAFEDYRVQAKAFSRMEMQILKALLPYAPTEKDILALLEAKKIDLSKREVTELVAKLKS